MQTMDANFVESSDGNFIDIVKISKFIRDLFKDKF